MSQYNPSGKIQRVPGGQLMSPGACFSCGSAGRPIYALLGHVEWYGTVYLCEPCCLETMTVFETLMVPAHESALRSEIATLERKLHEKDNQVKELTSINESYRVVFSNTGHRDPGRTSSGVSASPDSRVNGAPVVAGTFRAAEPDNGSSTRPKRGESAIALDDDKQDDENTAKSIAELLESTSIDSSGNLKSDDESSRIADKSSASERPVQRASSGRSADSGGFLSSL